jgi:HD superfamily phosphodiesterase
VAALALRVPPLTRTDLRQIDSESDAQAVFRSTQKKSQGLESAMTQKGFGVMTSDFKSDYPEAKRFMLACMNDSVHDAEHVYRVLGYANDIAAHEEDVNHDEAKILFDADKLDACGAVGIARTLQYAGNHSIPLYNPSRETASSEFAENTDHSFIREYETKLSRLYDNFFTKRGAELAAMRRVAAVNFYNALLSELKECNGGQSNSD